MKQKFLYVLLLLLVTNISYGQITGSTSYSLENAIIPTSNTEATITVDDDNELTFNQGTGDIIGQNGSHGAIMSNGNTITMRVASTAIITFSLCQYSAIGATFDFTDEDGSSLGSVIAESKTTGVDEETVDFAFSGESQVITATLNASGSVYLHAIAINNAAASESLDGKTEVWDFGAEQLDETTYLNRLDVEAINAWYTYTGDQAEGDAGRNVPASFTAGSLNWTSTSSSSDRLRTTNTDLTRYDSNISSDPYTGRLYVNGTAQTGRYFSLSLDEDDEITVVALSQNGNGVLNFVYVADAEEQTDLASLTGDAASYSFVAKQGGVYKIYDTVDKPSYFRIYRKNAVYSTVSGTVDVTAASGIPSDYTIVFTNEAGKTWSVDPSTGSYTVDLPTDYTYEVSLADANGYVLSSETSIEVTEAATNDVVIEAVSLYTVSGTVTGLGDDLSNLTLTYTPDDESKIFTPSVDLNTSTVHIQFNWSQIQLIQLQQKE